MVVDLEIGGHNVEENNCSGGATCVVENLSIRRRRKNMLKSLEEISHLTALKEAWTEEIRDQVIAEYKRFLRKAALGEAGRPTLGVDKLWHDHMLHTEIYERDCITWFGKFIHHRPCIPRNIDEALAARISRLRSDADDESNLLEQFFEFRPYFDDTNQFARESLADCGPGGPGISR